MLWMRHENIFVLRYFAPIVEIGLSIKCCLFLIAPNKKKGNYGRNKEHRKCDTGKERKNAKDKDDKILLERWQKFDGQGGSVS